MPSPIVPIHKQNDHDEMFTPTHGLDGVSSLQEMFLGPVTAAKKTYAPQTLAMLDSIYKGMDDTLTLAQTFVAGNNDFSDENELFRVPTAIRDYDLLGLKTQGLVAGSGRSVKLTTQGRTALRDHWLLSSNSMKSSSVKNKFDYQSALERFNNIRSANNTESSEVAQEIVAETKGRFKKTGS